MTRAAYAQATFDITIVELHSNRQRPRQHRTKHNTSDKQTVEARNLLMYGAAELASAHEVYLGASTPSTWSTGVKISVTGAVHPRWIPGE